MDTISSQAQDAPFLTLLTVWMSILSAVLMFLGFEKLGLQLPLLFFLHFLSFSFSISFFICPFFSGFPSFLAVTS